MREVAFKSDDKLISTKEAAAIMGIKSRTLETWRRLKPEGTIPEPYRIGAKCMYSEKEVRLWISARRAA